MLISNRLLGKFTKCSFGTNCKVHWDKKKKMQLFIWKHITFRKINIFFFGNYKFSKLQVFRHFKLYERYNEEGHSKYYRIKPNLVQSFIKEKELQDLYNFFLISFFYKKKKIQKIIINFARWRWSNLQIHLFITSNTRITKYIFYRIWDCECVNVCVCVCVHTH